MLKRLLLSAGFLFYFLPLASASENVAAQQMLATALRQASLFHNQNGPLQLDVDFVAQVNVPYQGHLTLKWKADDQWWRRITLGDFEQLDVRRGDTLYTDRNIGFTPVRVAELISLLQFAEGSEKLSVRKQKLRTEGGIEMLCFQVEGETRGKSHEICLNSASREILSNKWQEPPDEERAERYGDYADFWGRRYPRKLELLVNGVKVITATVKSVANSAFDESLLVPPKGAVERRQCAGMTHAIPLKTPDPMYPKSASEDKLTGDTVVAMTVLADGSVTDIQLAGRAARAMDEATLQTLKGWRFKPAMCGTEPVASNIQVVVSFRLR